MHVYFSGIGGTAIGPLALIAHEAGYTISGSDKQNSLYIDYLKKQGIPDIHIGQSRKQIAEVHARQPIDWFVYTSALPMENPNAPELIFCKEQNIKATKRDDFLSSLLQEKNLNLVAIAGTHGKTTTTAMAIWLCKQLEMPISYSVGAKLSFGDMGEYNPQARYFIYEADEFDRNFLSFKPALSIITGIDWDHPDIYPTRENYNQAFADFLNQSKRAVMWDEDEQLLGSGLRVERTALHKADAAAKSTLAGQVNRENALQVAAAISLIADKSMDELLAMLNGFPGVSRRFEKLAPNVYTDYAHTPPKIRGALQLAHEVAGDNVVVVYEGLHNTRQHFIKDDFKHLFDDVKHLYIAPSYLAREDPNLPLLQPADLKELLSNEAQRHTDIATLGDDLAAAIKKHQEAGDLVLCITAGGGNSLDEWLRKVFV